MRALPDRVVIDTSVLMKLVVPEPDSGLARALVAHCLNSPDSGLRAPALIFAECCNVLWKRVGRGDLTPDDATAAMAYILDVGVVSEPLEDVVVRALQLARLYGISGYDACFAALAERSELPLVTVDRRLIERLREAPIRVLALADLPPQAA